MSWVKTSFLANKYNVSNETIRRWIKQGKLKDEIDKVTKTKGGHLRIKIKNRKCIGYARVSSKKQLSSLETQTKLIREQGVNEIRYDVASGFNFKRKGFKAILESIIKGDFNCIMATTKDRITRVGYEWFNLFIQLHNSQTLIIDKSVETKEGFNVDELIGFITSYINSYHGKRSSKRKNYHSNKEDKNLS